jgi:hypothetical protein
VNISIKNSNENVKLSIAARSEHKSVSYKMDLHFKLMSVQVMLMAKLVHTVTYCPLHNI